MTPYHRLLGRDCVRCITAVTWLGESFNNVTGALASHSWFPNRHQPNGKLLVPAVSFCALCEIAPWWMKKFTEELQHRISRMAQSGEKTSPSKLQEYHIVGESTLDSGNQNVFIRTATLRKEEFCLRLQPSAFINQLERRGDKATYFTPAVAEDKLEVSWCEQLATVVRL